MKHSRVHSTKEREETINKDKIRHEG